MKLGQVSRNFRRRWDEGGSGIRPPPVGVRLKFRGQCSRNFPFCSDGPLFRFGAVETGSSQTFHPRKGRNIEEVTILGYRREANDRAAPQMEEPHFRCLLREYPSKRSRTESAFRSASRMGQCRSGIRDRPARKADEYLQSMAERTATSES